MVVVEANRCGNVVAEYNAKIDEVHIYERSTDTDENGKYNTYSSIKMNLASANVLLEFVKDVTAKHASKFKAATTDEEVLRLIWRVCKCIDPDNTNQMILTLGLINGAVANQLTPMFAKEHAEQQQTDTNDK